MTKFQPTTHFTEPTAPYPWLSFLNLIKRTGLGIAAEKVKYHLLFWLVYWLLQSFMMSEGHNVGFYLAKNVAMVSLQASVAYLNWMLLFPYLYQRGQLILYGLLSVVLVYLAFIYSFTWIEATTKTLGQIFPGLPIIDFPPVVFRYGFWEFFSSSVPYSLSLVGSLALKISIENDRNKRLAQALQIEKAQTEIQYLRAQINPHLLFNALNNIHTLVLKNPKLAAEYTVLLSNLLRYMLYEVRKERTALQNELESLDNYLRLVRLRAEQPKNIQFTHQIQTPDLAIVPLLLTSLVENGIKHSGVEYNSESWLQVAVREEKQKLEVILKNSFGPVNRSSEGQGIGLDNLKKRLALNYPGQHKFTFEKNTEFATTHLTLFTTSKNDTQ